MKKPTLAKRKKELWTLLSKAIREKYGPFCFTCGGQGTQAGHMFPKGRAHAISAWLPDNIRPQDYHCNINLGGNGAEFASRFIKAHGQTRFEQVERASQTQHKWTITEIETLISKLKIGLDHYEAFYETVYMQ